MLGGGVQFHADAVDAGFDGIIERGFERTLIDIMLVLADSDGFRVDFHKLRKWIHEATTDGDGSADGDVFVGEFLAGGLGGGVDGGPAFIDHNDLDGGGKFEFFDKCLGLA